MCFFIAHYGIDCPTLEDAMEFQECRLNFAFECLLSHFRQWFFKFGSRERLHNTFKSLIYANCGGVVIINKKNNAFYIGVDRKEAAKLSSVFILNHIDFNYKHSTFIVPYTELYFLV